MTKYICSLNGQFQNHVEALNAEAAALRYATDMRTATNYVPPFVHVHDETTGMVLCAYVKHHNDIFIDLMTMV